MGLAAAATLFEFVEAIIVAEGMVVVVAAATVAVEAYLLIEMRRQPGAQRATALITSRVMMKLG